MLFLLLCSVLYVFHNCTNQALVFSVVNTVTTFVQCIGLSVEMQKLNTKQNNEDDYCCEDSDSDTYVTAFRLPVAGIWLLFLSQVLLLGLSVKETKRAQPPITERHELV
jgi:hypothetical protein